MQWIDVSGFMTTTYNDYKLIIYISLKYYISKNIIIYIQIESDVDETVDMSVVLEQLNRTSLTTEKLHLQQPLNNILGQIAKNTNTSDYVIAHLEPENMDSRVQRRRQH